MTMTLEQFRDTGRYVANLHEVAPDDVWEPAGGMVYRGNLTIEDSRTWTSGHSIGCRWYLCLDRSEHESDDLGHLESLLYTYALNEGFLRGVAMTLEQFRQSGRDVEDLGVMMNEDWLCGVNGRVYGGGLWAVPCVKSGVGWSGQVGDREYEAKSLTVLEGVMYRKAKDLGLITA